MTVETFSTRHLVKGEDLNHHETLYAGRAVEWMVESGFMAASAACGDENIVCMRINSLLFLKSVPKGQMVNYESYICFTGKTSITVYVQVRNVHTKDFIFEGFLTYVHTDDDGHPLPHGIEIVPETKLQQELYDEAAELLEESKRDAARTRERRL